MDENLMTLHGTGLTSSDYMLLEEEQKRKQLSQQDNPFDSPQYKNVHTPDEPINYGGGMAEVLLSDNEVPAPLRAKYWWIFNKDNVLTFLDEKRKKDKMMFYDVAVIDMMNSMDSFDDYTFETELQYGLMRNALDVKLDRAVGFKGSNVKNERIVLQSQFSEARQINDNEGGGEIKQGFFKRLLGRR